MMPHDVHTLHTLIEIKGWQGCLLLCGSPKDSYKLVKRELEFIALVAHITAVSGSLVTENDKY